MKYISMTFFLLLSALPISLYGADADYLSPLSIISSESEDTLYVAEVTARRIAVVDALGMVVKKHISIENEPTGLALAPDNKSIYVSSGVSVGVIQQLDLSTGDCLAEINVGHSPIGPQISRDGKTLYVCNRFNNDISVVDLQGNIEITRVPVTREPIACVLSADGKLLFVANHLPNGAANVDHMTSVIDVIDTLSNKVIKSIALPNGAIDLRGMCLSHDGMFVYVPSILARFLVPPTQIERGWINTHALNIISVVDLSLKYTVLLDDVDLGAANPWGVKCSKNGEFIFVAHSATNELSIINRAGLFSKLEQAVKKNPAKSGYSDDYESLSNKPENDLSFLTGIRERVELPGIGPRGVAVLKEKVYVTQYFSGNLAVVTPAKRTIVSELSLGEVTEMDTVRRGEMYFNDAVRCFQQWHACSTCHPDGRTDAVNWDLLNDGIGNPKSTKSLLNGYFTPPTMITGTGGKISHAIRNEIRQIQFSVVEEDKANSLEAYFKSFKAVPSPYLVKGKLSSAALRGKEAFKKGRCFTCHSGPYYSGGTMKNVGTGIGMEEGRKFDTPHLIEVWRTAPYLHDGRATSIKQIFKEFNQKGKHGKGDLLSDQELDDLEEYVKSL